jgi:alkane 1-monooxygenase
MLRYGGPFAFLASVPLLYYGVAPAAPFITIAALLLALAGSEIVFPRGNAAMPADQGGFRALVLLYIPLQLGLIAWGAAIAATASGAGFAALVLSIGLTTGIFGMLAAHEAIHSGDPFEHGMGTAMLTGMLYRHFRIAHLFGHHRWAATAKDAATAKLGEGFYFFLWRTLPQQFREAMVFERRRCARARQALMVNRVLGDLAIYAVVLAAFAVFAGPRGLLFFCLQSVVAIIVLELFNYIAHYGLTRRLDDRGKPEALTDRHSWNSSNILANTLIFNMGRHSFHHARPSLSYQNLRQVEAAPELPAGYAGSILLALAPPLWRRVMDAKCAALARGR